MKNKDIISRQEICERMIKIAKGELKPSPKDPKIWYETKEIKEKHLKKE